MQFLTTTEAANLLGVSTRRIVAMVQAGILEGEKKGRDWLIDAQSVYERKKNNPGPGQPRKPKT